MIEETLLKSNYLGKDGFIWWLGQVAPPEVWDIPQKTSLDYENYQKSWAYRCKVRIIGYHTFDRTQLEDKDLPWAHIMLGPTDGNAQGGLGKTHKLIGGETVFGFFLDGDDAQQPVIIGTLHRNANVESFNIDEIAFKPFSGAKYGRVTQGPTKQTQVTVKQNPSTNTENSGNIIGGSMLPPVGVAVSTLSSKDKIFPCNKALQQAYATFGKVKIVSENGCDNNVIGKITRAIQDFIAVVNGLQGYLNTYIDPVLNVFTDIANEIKRTSRIIVGSIKFLINNMRNVLSKLIGCLFSKFVGLVVPIPQQPIIGESAKNIINIIFCVFEKIIDKLLPFLEDMLQGLVGRAVNAPLCAIEEFTATILNKVLDIIDDLLGPIFSGIDWLVGGLSQISSVLSKATSIATEIFNLIGCDNLKCKTPSEWTLNVGPSKSEYDNWNRVVNKMNIIRGFNDDLDVAVNYLSIFGGGGSPIFSDCANKVNNPQSQSDLGNTSIRAVSCIPPEIEIFGDGVGASAIAVVGDNGSILAIEILNPGFGYSRPPTVSIVDKSNYGSGAKAEALISNGEVSQIYITSTGSGYCKTNLDVLIRNQYYIVTADKYTFYEGETCTFTILSENVTDGTELSYYLSGDLNSNDIEGEFEGKIIIFNNQATVSIKILQDSNPEQIEELIFNLVDSNDNLVAKTVVLVNDTISPTLVPENNDQVQSPPGTPIPIGFTTSQTLGITTFFPVNTNTGVSTINVGVVTAIVIETPGLGYSNSDTISGITTQSLYVVSNDNGSIISISTDSSTEVITTSTTLMQNGNSPNPVITLPSGISLSEFTSLPEIVIDSNSGEGARIYPIIKFVPKNDQVQMTSINDKGILKIVDCV